MSRAPTKASRRGCFITATDTGVGKTVLASAVILGLRQAGATVGVMKPVETGVTVAGSQGTDARRLQGAAACDLPLECISPYALAAPLAPLAAARLAGIPIDVGQIMSQFRRLQARFEYVIVEGAGGVRVPVTDRTDMLGLIRECGLPAVVVGRAALGGVNHALLTLEALAREGVDVLALVLNDPAAAPDEETASTTALLREYSAVPVLGPLPHLPSMATSWEESVRGISRHPALLDLIARMQRVG